jgi:hypothetical protein
MTDQQKGIIFVALVDGQLVAVSESTTELMQKIFHRLTEGQDVTIRAVRAERVQ